MNFEEFCAELEEMKGWLSKVDREPASWWMSVEDYAKAEFTRHYKQAYSKKEESA